jgi:hypothetical protein
MSKKLILALALMAAPAIIGCGSNTEETVDSGTPGADAGLFGLSAGDNCYTVTAIATGYADGCDLGVEMLVTQSLPLKYTAATATVELGTEGSLGGGVIANNVGTLVRDGDTSFDATCTLHQTDTTQLTMIANNMFTVTVTEVQSNFGTGCAAADVPVGGTCTSTWTWTMTRSTDATEEPPLCGADP